MELLLRNFLNSLLDKFNAFTFQYGATSTKNEIKTLLEEFPFTFQYGATSTLFTSI